MFFFKLGAKVHIFSHIRKRVSFFYLFACEIQKNVVTLRSQSEQSVCRHRIKAFISACFRDSNSCKISSYLKQEGSKCPWGYDYPAAERPIVDCSV